MALASFEYCRVVITAPDPSFVAFVAKVQKAKTRKNKNYYVLRTTVPKDVAGKINAKPGDYLFFRAKKAEWYHLLDWEKMENTWRMLPGEIKNRVIMDGLFGQGVSSQMVPALEGTNLSASPQPLTAQYPNKSGW